MIQWYGSRTPSTIGWGTTTIVFTMHACPRGTLFVYSYVSLFMWLCVYWYMWELCESICLHVVGPHKQEVPDNNDCGVRRFMKQRADFCQVIRLIRLTRGLNPYCYAVDVDLSLLIQDSRSDLINKIIHSRIDAYKKEKNTMGNHKTISNFTASILNFKFLG